MAKGKDRSQGQVQQRHVQPPRKIAGFHVLPLTLDAGTTHYLYCRPHTGKAKQDAPSTSAAALLPPGRTLFVANLPVDATDRHLRRLFQKAGRVESVVIRQRAAVGEQLVQEDEAESEVSESDEGANEDPKEQESLGIDGTTTAAEQPRRMKKSAKREQQKKPQPPALVPLPLLNPRGQDAFLQTGKSAHVVFLESSGVERALEMVQRPRKWIDPLVEARIKLDEDDDDQDDGLDANGRRTKRPPPMTASEAQARSQAQQPPPPSGLSYLISSYDAHRPALSAIKAHADSAVARYTFFRSHRSLDPDRTSGTGANVGGIAVASYGPNGEPLDEDGFTIVMPGVAGAKYGRALGESSFGAKGGEFGSSVKVARRRPLGVDEEEERRAGKKSKRGKGGAEMAGLEDFYRFQTRERKREELAEMRRKFAEDQEKLEAMRGAERGQGKRRFRPY
ncbi:unnamed protein product [Jaminaea pallidilutea]